MAARKSKPKVAPLEVPQEDWFWGNHRGGGGAPLKDNDGNNVANLKKVIAGEVEVDHSPSPKAKRKPPKFRPDEYDEDDNDNYNQYSNKNNKNNYRDDRSDNNYRNNRDDDYPNNPTYNNNNKGRGKNYAPDEVVYTPPKKTGYGSFTNAANNASDYDKEMKMRKNLEQQDALRKQIEEKNRLKAAEKEEAERVKQAELAEYLQSQYKGKLPAHLNNKARGNDTSDERAHRQSAAVGGPKKKGGAAAAVNDDDEEYGNGGGARRKVPKFKEEFQDDNDDGSVGRRNPPQRKYRDDPEEEDNQYDNRKGGARGGNNNNRNRRGGADYEEDEVEDNSARNYNKKHLPPRGGGGVGGGGGGRRRGGEESDPEEEYDQPPPNRRGGGAGAGGGRGGGVRGSKDRDSSMVPLKEYDELSRLCDKLMDQQDAMHSEIKAQAKLIEELRLAKESKNAAARGGVKTGIAARGAAAAAKNIPAPLSPRGAYEAGFNGGRSKSVQQQRPPLGGAAAAKRGEGGGDRVSAMKRPSSMHTIAARDKQQLVDIAPPLGKPKVAFGGAAAGPAPVKNLKKTLANAAANSVVKSAGADRYAKIKTSPQKVAQAQELNGFARLAGNKGPVVVTHDSEDDVPPPRGGAGGGGRSYWGNDEEPAVAVGGRKKGGGAMKQSLELKGKSEYIRVSQEDDMISGDQLDRLLIQARKARVG